MMRIKLLFLLLLASPCFAQSPLTLETNYNGITQHWAAGANVNRGQIVKINSSGQVVPVATSDTSGAFGVAVTSAGQNGDMLVSVVGSPLVLTDGACVSGNVVNISSTVTGVGHCTASGSGQTIGVVVPSSIPSSGFANVQLSALSSAGTGGGGITSVSSLPATCTPGVTAPVNLTVATPGFPLGVYSCTGTNVWSPSITGATLESELPTGLLADYRMLASETAAALVDYSGNGNNATGTTGTAPTIIANTGGINCTGNGAVSLPAAVNGAKSIVALIGFQYLSNTTPAATYSNTIIGGSGGLATSMNWILYESLASNDTWGLAEQSAFHFRSVGTSGNNWHTSSKQAFNGIAVAALVMNANDTLYLNSQALTNFSVNGTSAGQQSAGVLQICGSATPGFFNGQIYALAAWSSLLTPAQVATATQIMQNQKAALGLQTFVGSPNTDNNEVIVTVGDSLTAGLNWPIPLASGVAYSVADMGLSGDTTGSLFSDLDTTIDYLYHAGALRTPLTYWTGSNDLCNSATTCYASAANTRAFVQNRKNKGFKVAVATMVSRGGQDLGKDILNGYLNQYIPTFADGIISLGANVHLGADGANANTTYFNVDTIHLTTFSDNYLIGPYVIHAVDRLYGNTLQAGNYNRYSGTGTSIPVPMQTADSPCTNLSGASVNCAMPFNTTSGNFLAMTVICQSCTGATINLPTSAGDTWNAVSAQAAIGSNGQMRNFYAMNITSGAKTVTQTFTGGTPASIFIKITEFSGIATAAALDVASAIATGTSVSPLAASITTTVPGDLLMSMGGSGNLYFRSFTGTSWVPQAGATQLTTDWNDYQAYSVGGSAGAFIGSATLWLSASWGLQTAAFKTVAGSSVYQVQDVDIYSTCAPNGANNVGLNLPDGAWMAGETVTIHNEQTAGSATCTVNGTTPYATGVAQQIDGANSLLIPNNGTVELKSTLTYTGVAGTNQSPVINWTQVKSNGIPATNNNCTSSASPAVCGSASGGVFTLPAAATTVTVNTTAVTANSIILVFNDDSLGTRLGVTCNTALDNVLVSAKVAGTSFTITGSAPVTNPNCYSFVVIN